MYLSITVQHRCHSDESCPPCTVLTEKWCMGKHEVSSLSLSCSLSAVILKFSEETVTKKLLIFVLMCKAPVKYDDIYFVINLHLYVKFKKMRKLVMSGRIYNDVTKYHCFQVYRIKTENT